MEKLLFPHSAPILGAFSYFSYGTVDPMSFLCLYPRKVSRRNSLRDNVTRMCLRFEYEIFNVTSWCIVHTYIDVYCGVVLQYVSSKRTVYSVPTCIMVRMIARVLSVLHCIGLTTLSYRLTGLSFVFFYLIITQLSFMFSNKFCKSKSVRTGIIGRVSRNFKWSYKVSNSK